MATRDFSDYPPRHEGEERGQPGRTVYSPIQEADEMSGGDNSTYPSRYDKKITSVHREHPNSSPKHSPHPQSPSSSSSGHSSPRSPPSLPPSSHPPPSHPPPSLPSQPCSIPTSAMKPHPPHTSPSHAPRARSHDVYHGDPNKVGSNWKSSPSMSRGHSRVSPGGTDPKKHDRMMSPNERGSPAGVSIPGSPYNVPQRSHESPRHYTSPPGDHTPTRQPQSCFSPEDIQAETGERGGGPRGETKSTRSVDPMSSPINTSAGKTGGPQGTSRLASISYDSQAQSGAELVSDTHGEGGGEGEGGGGGGGGEGGGGGGRDMREVIQTNHVALRVAQFSRHSEEMSEGGREGKEKTPSPSDVCSPGLEKAKLVQLSSGSSEEELTSININSANKGQEEHDGVYFPPQRSDILPPGGHVEGPHPQLSQPTYLGKPPPSSSSSSSTSSSQGSFPPTSTNYPSLSQPYPGHTYETSTVTHPRGHPDGLFGSQSHRVPPYDTPKKGHHPIPPSHHHQKHTSHGHHQYQPHSYRSQPPPPSHDYHQRSHDHHVTGSHDPHMTGHPPTHDHHMTGHPPPHDHHMTSHPPTHDHHMTGHPPPHDHHMTSHPPTHDHHMTGHPPPHDHHMTGHPPPHDHHMTSHPPPHDHHMTGPPPPHDPHMTTPHDPHVTSHPPPHDNHMMAYEHRGHRQQGHAPHSQQRRSDHNVPIISKQNLLKAHEASVTGDLVTLHHMLINQEIDALCMDDTGLTLAHTAAMTNNLSVIIMLVNEGGLPLHALQLPDENLVSPAMVAIQNGCVEVLQWLVEKGKVPLVVKDAGGETLVHHAAHHDQVSCLQWLLIAAKPQKADDEAIEFLDNFGVTPAHFAAQQGHLECLQLMIDHNYSVVTPDKESQKPIDWADAMGQTLCVRYLFMHETCLALSADVSHLSIQLDALQKENVTLKEKLSSQEQEYHQHLGKMQTHHEERIIKIREQYVDLTASLLNMKDGGGGVGGGASPKTKSQVARKDSSRRGKPPIPPDAAVKKRDGGEGKGEAVDGGGGGSVGFYRTATPQEVLEKQRNTLTLRMNASRKAREGRNTLVTRAFSPIQYRMNTRQNDKRSQRHADPHRPSLKVQFSGVNQYIDHGHYGDGNVHTRHGDGSHPNEHGEQDTGRKGQSPAHAPSGHPSPGHSSSHSGHPSPGHSSGYGISGHKEQSVDRGRHEADTGHSRQHQDGGGSHWKDK